MTSRAIALAASKGGAGKTTLAAALAVQAMRDGGKVALIDAEPQQSLTLWWKLRDRPENPKLHVGADDPVESVDHLKAEGFDWIFIDTPPLDMDRIERSIEAADFVLIPVRTSIFDLAATRAVVGLCNKHHRSFAFMLSATDPKAVKMIATAISALKKIGPVLPKMTRARPAYQSALNFGKTGPEHPDSRQAKEPRAEMEAIWRAVKKMASAAQGGRS